MKTNDTNKIHTNIQIKLWLLKYNNGVSTVLVSHSWTNFTCLFQSSMQIWACQDMASVLTMSCLMRQGSYQSLSVQIQHAKLPVQSLIA